MALRAAPLFPLVLENNHPGLGSHASDPPPFCRKRVPMMPGTNTRGIASLGSEELLLRDDEELRDEDDELLRDEEDELLLD
jgi:hypothetical protein